MGLYNFQKRFVSKILSGEKTHTIRGIRARPDKPGNTLHLYVGLRSRGTRLLMRVPCVKVESIYIDENHHVEIAGQYLSDDECESLAKRDGFENFADMMKFWDDGKSQGGTGRLPFKGHIIHWRTP